MKPGLLGFCVLLSFYSLRGFGSITTENDTIINILLNEIPVDDEGKITNSLYDNRMDKLELTPMEALDLVKDCYAANFDRVQTAKKENYYYKLSFADYYLVYEGQGETEQQYLYHLYEFVLDDPQEGIGHTITYGWYMVDQDTGIINVQQ
jgi:hypothetical protein